MNLCKCEGSRRVERIGSWDGCLLEGFAHTSFMLLKCSICGGISGFPPKNLEIALKTGTPETKGKLAEIIKEATEDVEKYKNIR